MNHMISDLWLVLQMSNSVKSESRPVVSEQSVNGRPGPETDYGTTNLSVL